MQPPAEPKLRNVQARTLRQEVAAALRAAILDGRWEPGQRLVESALADELGVGRTPIREALSQLEQQGLVHAVPNQGTFVIEPNPEESYQVLMLRAYLETLAARLAALRGETDGLRQMAQVVQRMADLSNDAGASLEHISQTMFALDREYHHHLIEASGSPVLRQVWAMVSPHIWLTMMVSGTHRGVPWPPWRHAYADRQGPPEDVYHHQALVDAIRSGDMERIEQVICYHHSVSLPTTDLDATVLAAIGRPIPGLRPIEAGDRRAASGGEATA